MQYWPKQSAAPTTTATFSLALTDADSSNGCLRVIPQSGLARALLSERSASAAAGPSASGSERAIVLPLTESELARTVRLPVRRGDVTVHDEWIVHGSGGNPSDRVRKTYVAAFRDSAMVAYERSIGFTHSYNDGEEILRRVRSGEV